MNSSAPVRNRTRALAAAALLLTPLFGHATSASEQQISAIVAAVAPQTIEQYLRKLVSFGTRHTASQTDSPTRGIGAARTWIESELKRCSAQSGNRLQITLDRYLQPAGSGLTQATPIVNVVATLPGTQKEAAERIYVVSGHYDSRASDLLDARSDAPGANDDASGSAAVMALACAMAHYRFDATLVFLTVAGEEQGLYGATHWAESASQRKWNIAGMFTNDIIGSSHDENGKFDGTQVRLFAQGIPAQKEMPEALRILLATGGENDSPSRQLARYVKQSGERYVPGFTVNIVPRRDRYLRGGDHIPFLERGYPALRFTEPNEDFRHQHQNVRTEEGTRFGDLMDFVDVDYVTRVARVNAAALAALALAPAAPAHVQMSTARLENDTELLWQANQEPDLAGYRVMWRETGSPDWQDSVAVGNVTRFVVKGRSKDNYFFAVQAVDSDGNLSVASYPTPLR